MTRRRHLLSSLTAMVLGLLAVVGIALGVALPAAAHPVVVSSSPPDEARVPEPLTEIRIRFSEPVTPLEVIVEDPSEEEIQEGAPELEEDAVVQPLSAFQERGDHTVTYRLLAADDHITEGSFTFRYTGPTELAPDPDQGEEGAAPALPAEPDAGPTTTAPARSLWPLVSIVTLVTVLVVGTMRTVRVIGEDDDGL